MGKSRKDGKEPNSHIAILANITYLLAMIAMPKLIPAPIWSDLSLAIARGETSQVRDLVEQNKLDVNAFVDTGSWMPLLMEALLSYGFNSEEDRLELLRYLLDKGADPNIRCRRGYNCLHIAVQQEKYLPALNLFLDYRADVNVGDEDGSNIVYWAIQGWLLRRGRGAETQAGHQSETQAENQTETQAGHQSESQAETQVSQQAENRAAHLKVLQRILEHGADLDQENRYGMCARKWLEAAAPDVRETVARWEQAKPAVRPTTTVQPNFPVNLHYPDIAYKIWTELVPRTGTATTVYGELLQAVEKLRDDARRNANNNNRKSNNYRKRHKRMAIFIRDTLIDSRLFDKSETDRIRNDTHRLMKSSRPYTNDDIYDHLVDQVCIYYKEKPPRFHGTDR